MKLGARTAVWALALSSIPLLGMAGASLFYGDAMITPAISILSAVEASNSSRQR